MDTTNNSPVTQSDNADEPRLPTNEEFFKDMKAESTLNRGDELPFGYTHPCLEGKLTWICGEDQTGKITSVFLFQENEKREKKVEYLASKDDALKHRQLLIDAGWRPLAAPKITFTHPVTGKEVDHLSRSEKRALAKKIRELAKKEGIPKSKRDA